MLPHSVLVVTLIMVSVINQVLEWIFPMTTHYVLRSDSCSLPVYCWRHFFQLMLCRGTHYDMLLCILYKILLSDKYVTNSIAHCKVIFPLYSIKMCWLTYFNISIFILCWVEFVYSSRKIFAELRVSNTFSCFLLEACFIIFMFGFICKLELIFIIIFWFFLKVVDNYLISRSNW